jgi:hypothetical protein
LDCIVDFNEVLHRSKHVGVQERSLAQIADFREMVDVCGLRDLGYEGRSWNFEKRVAGGSFFRVRLDRALATTDWCSRFPLASVQNLTAVSFDHGPILLTWAQQVEATREKKRNKLFKYEMMWESQIYFPQMMVQTWKDEGASVILPELQQKLTGVSGQLQSWGRHTFGHVENELKKLKEELEKM